MKIYYFSSTGNSYYVSRRIKEEIKESEIISVSKCEGDIVIEGESVGFVYPIHCGSLPITMRDFLLRAKFQEVKYIFAIGVTGGGEADLSFTHIEEITGRGLDNAFTVKYVSNYIRAGRNATKDRVLESVNINEQIIKEIIKDLKNKKVRKIEKKGSLEGIIYKCWTKLYKNKDKNFNVDSNCIGCGICSRVCPSKNITIVEGKPKWNGNCTDCMGCINLCPKKSINIGKKTRNKERYINPLVKLEELL